MSFTVRLLIACAVLVVSREAEAQSFPVALQRDAAARACTPMADTSGYPGLELPLFLFAEGRPDASALYWCTRGADAPKTFLIFLRPPAGCPEEIPYWNPPAGLAIELPRSVRLSDFRSVLEPERFGPAETTTVVPIRAEYDGAGGTFVCHGGKWYVAHFH